ncbi:MAG: DUF5690 family protein [Pirellulales bacterium]
MAVSFILADGVMKSAGNVLLTGGWFDGLPSVPERWMPAAAGLLFTPALLVCVWMLSKIPRPTTHDEALRSHRVPLDVGERHAFLKQYGVSVAAIAAIYLVVTILRGIRGDFGPELWSDLHYQVDAGSFARSESIVMFAVLIMNGGCALIRDNRRVRDVIDALFIRRHDFDRRNAGAVCRAGRAVHVLGADGDGAVFSVRRHPYDGLRAIHRHDAIGTPTSAF